MSSSGQNYFTHINDNRYQVFSVDSSDKASGTVSDFNVTLPQNHTISSMRLVTAEIPFAWYVIRTGVNDKIDFNEGAADIAATISAGSYTSTTMATEIKDKIQAASTAGDGRTYTVSVSTITGKMTIATSTGTFTLKWQSGANANTTIAPIIGYSTAADDTGSTSYIGDNLINLSGERYIYVKTDSAKGVYHGVTSTTSGDSDNGDDVILAKIPVCCNFGSTIFFQDLGAIVTKFIKLPSLSNSINFKLTFAGSDDAIDMNGIDWSLTFSAYD